MGGYRKCDCYDTPVDGYHINDIIIRDIVRLMGKTISHSQTVIVFKCSIYAGLFELWISQDIGLQQSSPRTTLKNQDYLAELQTSIYQPDYLINLVTYH